MYRAPKIYLKVPEPNPKGRYFSFQVKQPEAERPAFRGNALVVLSGLNGDFKTFRRHLLKLGIIDSHYRWSFGKKDVIILGNTLDSEARKCECLWLIYGLERPARLAGGGIHLLLGQNEINNMDGQWRFAHPPYAGSKSTGLISAVLYNANGILADWLKTKQTSIEIGDMVVTTLNAATYFEYMKLRRQQQSNKLDVINGLYNMTILGEGNYKCCITGSMPSYDSTAEPSFIYSTAYSSRAFSSNQVLYIAKDRLYAIDLDNGTKIRLEA